ncbi:hypothetical protein [Eubacterium xylanophilum]|uniref:hypothetical protein n=1 Tax=Eubacterium xylanophilum TaxID=39497 RepID=UPI0004AC7DB8|nr:hypothetical protein [Eubacterium xylanophilum]
MNTKIGKEIVKVVCIVLGALLLVNTSFNAFASSTYEKDYTIGNILTDYNLFAKEKIVAEDHIVGAVACGGEGSLSVFGNGATENSYCKELTKGYYTDESWLGSGYKDKVLLTGEPSYIDFDTAFASLNAESAQWAKSGYTVTEDDLKDAVEAYPACKTLVLDFSKHDSFIIPNSIYEKCKYISIMNLDIDSIEDKRSVISFPDEPEVKLSFSYTWSGNTENIKGVLYNSLNIGKTFNNDNSLKNLMDSTNEQGAQLNQTGMKLVWNMPNANNVYVVDDTAGHVVAPNAEFASTGIFEGGVIAKNINTKCEGHYYSYNKVGTVETAAPTVAPTATATATATVAPTATATAKATATATVAPTATATAKATATATVAPTATATTVATVAPTKEVTAAPTAVATAVATKAPTVAPTKVATEAPTVAPTAVATEVATVAPTKVVTAAPTVAPTEVATAAPTVAPTAVATAVATVAPTKAVTAAPTVAPTEVATEAPTVAPTAEATEVATVAPTKAVTAAPTVAPTAEATEVATVAPTKVVTAAPTVAPTEVATEAPTVAPTAEATETAQAIETEMPVSKSEVTAAPTSDVVDTNNKDNNNTNTVVEDAKTQKVSNETSSTDGDSYDSDSESDDDSDGTSASNGASKSKKNNKKTTKYHVNDNNRSGSVAQTGDKFPIELVIFAIVFSVVMIVALIVIKKKA